MKILSSFLMCAVCVFLAFGCSSKSNSGGSRNEGSGGQGGSGNIGGSGATDGAGNDGAGNTNGPGNDEGAGGDPIDFSEIIESPTCDEENELAALPRDIESCDQLGDGIVASGEPLKWIINNYLFLDDIPVLRDDEAAGGNDQAEERFATYGRDIDGQGTIPEDVTTLSRINEDGQDVTCSISRSREKQDFYDATRLREGLSNDVNIDNNFVKIANAISFYAVDTLRELHDVPFDDLRNNTNSYVNYHTNYLFKYLLILELQPFVNAVGEPVCGQFKIYSVNQADQADGIQTEAQEVFETARNISVTRQRITANQEFALRENQKLLDQPIALKTCEANDTVEAYVETDLFPAPFAFTEDTLYSGFRDIHEAGLRFQYNENEITIGAVSGAFHLLQYFDFLNQALGLLSSDHNFSLFSVGEIARLSNESLFAIDTHLGGVIHDMRIQAPFDMGESIFDRQWTGPAGLELPVSLLSGAKQMTQEDGEYAPNCQVNVENTWHPVMLIHTGYCTAPLGDSATPSPDGENYDRTLGEATHPNLLVDVDVRLFPAEHFGRDGTDHLKCEGVSVGYGFSGVSATTSVIAE